MPKISIHQRYLRVKHVKMQGSEPLNNADSKIEDTQIQGSKLPNNSDDKVRWFLVISTVILMVLTPIIYLVTRDIGVLLSGTFIWLAVNAVFSYYFRK